jgi:hypothetical protein
MALLLLLLLVAAAARAAALDPNATLAYKKEMAVGACSLHVSKGFALFGGSARSRAHRPPDAAAPATNAPPPPRASSINGKRHTATPRPAPHAPPTPQSAKCDLGPHVNVVKFT